METILRNKKLNELVDLIDTDLDLAKDKLLKSEQLFKTIIKITTELKVHIKEDMSLKQKLQLEKLDSQIVYMQSGESVTYRKARPKLQPWKDYVMTLLEEGITTVPTPDLAITSDIVIKALQDAKTLTIKHGAPRSLDRLHTAFHGYLKTVCDEAKIRYPNDPSITQLWKVLREGHPALKAESPHKGKIDTIVKSISNVVDTFNQMRNTASAAHPNETLEEAEAIFVINAINTVFTYLNTKFKKTNKD